LNRAAAAATSRACVFSLLAFECPIRSVYHGAGVRVAIWMVVDIHTLSG